MQFSSLHHSLGRADVSQLIKYVQDVGINVAAIFCHFIFFSILFAFLQWRHSSKEEKKRNKKSYDHILIFLDGSHPVNRYTDYEAAFFNDIHTILFSSLACLFVCLRLRQQVWWVYATFAHLKRAIWLLFN